MLERITPDEAKSESARVTIFLHFVDRRQASVQHKQMTMSFRSRVVVAWIPLLICPLTSYLLRGGVDHKPTFLQPATAPPLPARRTMLLSSTAAPFVTTEASRVLAPRPHVNWIIRPATVHDRDGCAALIQKSFGTLLAADYSEECLAKCLPFITSPREQLLDCNTWFVAEHPSTRQIVGCGGWTVRRRPQDDSVDDETKPLRQLVPQLRHFAVRPDYTRMGIASKLWKITHAQVQMQFAASSLPFPILEVYSTLTAESFYESCGFVHVKRVEFQLGKNSSFPTILMRRAPTEGSRQ